MTKYIRKTRSTKKKYSVTRCDAVTSKRCKSGRIVKTKISKRYNKMVKKGGDCHKRPAGSTPVTPGFEYLQELRGGTKDHDSVYMCIGHGCDIEGEVLVVPPNCNYITRTVCGITANEDSALIFDFLDGKLDISNLKSDLKKYETYQFEESSKDAAFSHVVTYEFRNHTEGQPYVNNKNATFLRLGWPAGLRKFGNPHTTGDLLDGRIKQDYTLVKTYLISQLQWYLLHFKESLFPTQEQVNRCLQTDAGYYSRIANNYVYSKIGKDNKQFIDMMHANFGIDYDCIMDVFPGTHINYGCRGICGTLVSDTEGTNSFVAQQRIRSGNTPLVVETQFAEGADFQDSDGTLSDHIKQLIERNKK
jgi:hypothetical protein